MFETFLKYLGLYFKLFFFSLQQQTATFIMRQETKGLSSIFAKAGCRKLKKKKIKTKELLSLFGWQKSILSPLKALTSWLAHTGIGITQISWLWLTSYFILLPRKIFENVGMKFFLVFAKCYYWEAKVSNSFWGQFH